MSGEVGSVSKPPCLKWSSWKQRRKRKSESSRVGKTENEEKGIFSPKEDLNKPSGVLTPSVLIADVREPPDVAQIDGESDDGEEEIHLFAPLVPGVAVGVRGRGAGGGTQAGLLCHPATPANPAGFRLSNLGPGRIFLLLMTDPRRGGSG